MTVETDRWSKAKEKRDDLETSVHLHKINQANKWIIFKEQRTTAISEYAEAKRL